VREHARTYAHRELNHGQVHPVRDQLRELREQAGDFRSLLCVEDHRYPRGQDEFQCVRARNDVKDDAPVDMPLAQNLVSGFVVVFGFHEFFR
jgi:hypothetical protein